jgi:hypothetical protein
MQVGIVDISSVDGEPLEDLVVADQVDASVWVRVLAGPSGGPGYESFDVNVCTPRWLEREIERTGPFVGRHLLIVNRWDAPIVRARLTGLFQTASGENWAELAEKLARIGAWEIEDYRPYPSTTLRYS